MANAVANNFNLYTQIPCDVCLENNLKVLLLRSLEVMKRSLGNFSQKYLK
jgi:hypothetical protein